MAEDQQEPSAQSAAPLELLLCELFVDYPAFYRFARDLVEGDKIFYELPKANSSQSLAEAMFVAISTLRGAGFIDASFFKLLVSRFPKKRAEIDAEAMRWRLAPSYSPSLQVEPKAMAEMPVVKAGRWIVPVLGSVIVIALLVWWRIGQREDPNKTLTELATEPSAAEPVAPSLNSILPTSEPAPPLTPTPTASSSPSPSDSLPVTPPHGTVTKPTLAEEPTGRGKDGAKTDSRRKTPHSGSPQPPSVRSSDFKAAIEKTNFKQCEAKILAGGGVGKGTRRVFTVKAILIASGDPRVNVFEDGGDTSKAASGTVGDCVKTTVRSLINEQFPNMKSDGALEASVTLTVP